MNLCSIVASADASTSLDYNGTITVYAGEEERQFTVHTHKICAKSKLFDDACSDRSTRTEQKPIKLGLGLGVH
jgi:hypothetical protein